MATHRATPRGLDCDEVDHHHFTHPRTLGTVLGRADVPVRGRPGEQAGSGRQPLCGGWLSAEAQSGDEPPQCLTNPPGQPGCRGLARFCIEHQLRTPAAARGKSLRSLHVEFSTGARDPVRRLHHPPNARSWRVECVRAPMHHLFSAAHQQSARSETGENPHGSDSAPLLETVV